MGHRIEQPDRRSLGDTLERIPAVDPAAGARAQELLDEKTKPRGSLGRLEEIACRVAAMRGEAVPAPPVKAIVVMAADHGVAAEGVSAYPQAVTRQMVLNFLAGGAAINVLAGLAGARLVVVDMGVAGALPVSAGLRVHRLGAGTANLAAGPAMSRDQATAGLEAGIAIAGELASSGTTLLGIGDMGIGNTTAAAALATVLTAAPAEAVTGSGTGVSAEVRRRKVAVVRRAIEVNRPDPGDPLDVLAKLGGFEIAGLAGVVLGAAAQRVPVMVDGLIAAAAALVAARLAPRSAGFLLASHRSVEPGHGPVLASLGLEPLLDLGLRLGEGTGAALAMHLVDAALGVLHGMSSFAAAGVSDSGA